MPSETNFDDLFGILQANDLEVEQMPDEEPVPTDPNKILQEDINFGFLLIDQFELALTYLTFLEELAAKLGPDSDFSIRFARIKAQLRGGEIADEISV